MSKLTGLLFIISGIGIASYAIPSDRLPTGATTKQLDSAGTAAHMAIAKRGLTEKSGLANEKPTLVSNDFVSTAWAGPASKKRRPVTQSVEMMPKVSAPAAVKPRPRSFSSGQPLLLQPPLKVTRKDVKARVKTIIADHAQRSPPTQKKALPTGVAPSTQLSSTQNNAPADKSGNAVSRFVASFPAGIARFLAALNGGQPSKDISADGSNAVAAAKRPAPHSGLSVVRTVTPKPITAAVITVSGGTGSDEKRFAETKPADDLERMRLARDLQTELRRIGCYRGAIDGNWGQGSRKAMRAFNKAVSATLPVDKPDYILLTMVQGHVSTACGKTCAAGSTLSHNGTCITPTILATTKSVPQKVTKRWRATQSKSVTRNWPTSTTVAAKKSVVAPKRTTQRTIAVRQAVNKPQKTRRLKPLPGKMAIRGPTRLQPRSKTRKPRVISRTNTDRVKKAEAGSRRAIATRSPRRASRFSADRPLVKVRRRAKAASAATAKPRRAAIKMPGPMIRTPSIVPLSRTAAIRVAKQRTLSTNNGPVIDVPRPVIAASRPAINSRGTGTSSAQDGTKIDTVNPSQNKKARATAEPKPARATRQRRARTTTRRRSRRARARPRPRRYRPTYSLGAKKRRSRPRRVRRARSRGNWKRRVFSTGDGA